DRKRAGGGKEKNFGGGGTIKKKNETSRGAEVVGMSCCSREERGSRGPIINTTALLSLGRAVEMHADTPPAHTVRGRSDSCGEARRGVGRVLGVVGRRSRRRAEVRCSIGLMLFALMAALFIVWLAFPFVLVVLLFSRVFFFFQAEDGIRDWSVTGVQTCALPI